MFLRMAAAVLAYALSSVGILLMCKLIVEELRTPEGPSLFIFVWLAACLIHAVMTVTWVCNRKLSRVWPVVGTAAGIGCFLVWPFLAIKDGTLFGGDAAASAGILLLTVTQIVLVVPCLLLAAWLVRFHGKTNSAK